MGTKVFLKLSHASTLAIWIEEIQAKSESELRKQQYTVTLLDCNHLARGIVLWQIKNIMCYCTVFNLFYFVFEGNFKIQAPESLYSGAAI